MPHVRPLLSYGYLSAVLAFIYLPILIMMAMGFNQSSSYELPFHFDLVWYEHLSANEVLWHAGCNSVLLALASSAVSSVIGTMAALAFARYRLQGQVVLQLLLFPAMAVPWLILATAMLIFFYYSGVGRGLHAMLLAHVALALPYVIIVVGARLRSYGQDLEEAAATLGAKRGYAVMRIIVPAATPALLTGFALALARGLGEYGSVIFIAGNIPGVSEIAPLLIVIRLQEFDYAGATAIACEMLAVSFALLLAVNLLQAFSRRKFGHV
jgi:spermidine/putrescine transport system permease protein